MLHNDGNLATAAISSWSQPQHGSVSLAAGGKFIYRPDQGFTGVDSFTYTLSNDHGQHATAKASIRVLPATLKLAVIGDYGSGNADERRVADLVKSWSPDAIVTLGDNIYGSTQTYDDAVGRFYAAYIGNYHGAFGSGSPVNRFFPALGNHDYTDAGLAQYQQYFTLPAASSGNERYYSVRLGPVELFFLNSDQREPAGNDANSLQAKWLKSALAH